MINSELNNKFESVGVLLPEILLPAEGVDLYKWSVIACDQYTSQPEYWEKVEKTVGDDPSTLKLILPEVFLENNDVEERINKINITMKKYLDEGILCPQKPCFVYLDRETPRVKSRKGLLLAIDLEKYDYNKGSETMVRATEKTVIERLPSRVKIRKNAIVEIPHIQLLIDDPGMTVIEPLSESIGNLKKIYDFDLMMGGGHVTGYRVDDYEIIKRIVYYLEKLASPANFSMKYNTSPEKGVLLFAVGDGNHSLASAKVHWENIKSVLPEEQRMSHPARYAMAEVINIHDSGLIFEPIHRVLFNVNHENLLNEMLHYFESYSNVSLKTFVSIEDSERELELIKKSAKGCHIIPFAYSKGRGAVIIEKPRHNLDAGTLQEFLDYYISKNEKTKIDYIHGENVVSSIAQKEGNFGFYLPPINKHRLFKTVISDGTLPRKTFSMGEAEEKRYYLECRKII
ncbi:MAG: DUF1015 domain-containing protein [Firmicutes bacterium]|nr:DUF1015 domain-containing protein [Bacillota bacterium]